jgi:integrase
VLEPLPRVHPWVFANKVTGKPYASIRKNFERALLRAGITSGDVSFHTLRHTALSRMIAAGFSDHTVMAISGHASLATLSRYVHPVEDEKRRALDQLTPLVSTRVAQPAAGETLTGQTSRIC